MPKNHLALQQPLDAIIFDCDGTLSAIEGIDELAEQNGVGNQVKELTSEAMERSGLTEHLYQMRLELVRPTQSQVAKLGEVYLEHVTLNTKAVIQVLKQLGKDIYLVSAGLSPAVTYFGTTLQIPEENIFAVDIKFDSHGNYKDFDHTSPLVTGRGKRDIINLLKKDYPRLAHIGDGLNDTAVMDLVTRFIGYGGTYYRKNIEEICEFYVKSKSMADILPYLLTHEEMQSSKTILESKL